MYLITIESKQGGEVKIQHISKTRECSTIKKAWNYANELNRFLLDNNLKNKFKAVITDLKLQKQYSV